MTVVDTLPVRAVRAWCRLYTSGLHPAARDRRRLELESDMWEHLHDPSESDVARALIGRFIRGIPADVRWRYRTLLDSRGARQRSEEMQTSKPTNWWSPLTAVFAAVLLAIGLLTLLAGGNSDAPAAVTVGGTIVGFLAGGLIFGGLSRRRSDVIAGSRLIFTGGVLALVGGLEMIPVGVLVLVSGFWTGNLRLSEADDAPNLHPTPATQQEMTRHWYVWLAAAVVLFAVGWLPLIFDDPDDLSFGGYFTWALSWLAAIVLGGVGVILAGLRAVVRHRTRLV
jgi:hypothetical protein